VWFDWPKKTEEKHHLQDGIPKGKEQHQTYLALTVRRVLLCRINNDTVQHTKPEPLVDGATPASDRAVELLFMATHCTHCTHPAGTRIHELARELQDRVISHTLLGPVQAAQLGCLLDLGTPFMWWYGGRPIESMTHRTDRTEFSPVEQRFWFGIVLVAWDICEAAI
jgi:hypothetical protein